MHKILYLAPTGCGKTSSLRNLDPKETAIGNIDMKALPLKGWRTNYATYRDAAGKVDFERTNYIELESPGTVLRVLEAWEKQEWVKTVVLDTLTHMITYDYMTNTIGKDFKAYQAMGKNFYEIIQFIRKSKKNIVVMGHIDSKIDNMGNVVWDMKAQGNMIKDLVPASYFTTVLLGEVHRTKDEKPKYLVRTQSEGNDPAKSPAAFDAAGEATTALELYEPNDVALILEKLTTFETT